MTQYRTIWMSDMHLGAPDCRVDLLVDFLNRHGCDTLFLVGDVIDIRKIRRARSWPRRHEIAVAALLQKVTSSKVVYIAGNHDGELAWLRSFSSSNFSICRERTHVTADGRRILVIHGDQVDREIRTDIPEWKVDAICFGYYSLMRLDRAYNAVRKLFRYEFQCLVSQFKRRVESWRNYRDSYVRSIVQQAVEKGTDGVLCGHIHWPEILVLENVLYLNCGDWVEHCTAVAETYDGRLWLLRHTRNGTAVIAEPIRISTPHAPTLRSMASVR